MDYDHRKVEEVTMALLALTMFKDDGGVRTWKSHDWEVMNALHERGWIANPRTKARSVGVTEEGERTAKELFRKFFGAPPETRRSSPVSKTTSAL